MGMDKTVRPCTGLTWTALRDFLGQRQFLLQLRMIDGELALPEETPPHDWRELRVSTPTGMMARLLEGLRADLILIPCKSAGLGWAVVETILCHRPVKHRIDEATLELASKDYRKLSTETAERTVRFWQLHDKIEK